MKSSIEKLHTISNKNNKKIIGLMSGTSLDGLDIALCEVKANGKNTAIHLENFITIPYTDEVKAEIKSVFAKKNIELEKLCLLNEWIAVIHANMIIKTLENWGVSAVEIDLIASHGQTIYHAPLSLHQNNTFGNGTLQIGDGDHMAVKTGIITIADFRQKHIAAGGEGAPIATYGDYLLFSDKHTNRILLNIGGISNLTFIPADKEFEEVISTDIGPGNNLMNEWMLKHFTNESFDKDAIIAKKGIVNEELLVALQSNPFFKNTFPKTTGPELFNLSYIEDAIRRGNNPSPSNEDVMATLNRFTAVNICEAINHFIADSPNSEILISGGGIHNPLLMSFIKNHFNQIPVNTTSEKGIHPDAKEAILFAILANETISGDKNTFGSGSKNMPNVSMGKICLPD